MNLLFQIELKTYTIGSIGYFDYQLDFDLTLLNYQLSPKQYSSKDFLDGYFKELMKGDYCQLILNSGSEETQVSFGRHLINVSMKMSSEKILNTIKQYKDVDVKKRLLRLELTENELSKFPSREEIEDDDRSEIKILFYKFEFTY